MNKIDFLLALEERLCALPWEEISDRCDYYSEIIDDRMEDGLSEEEAVAELGTVEEIAELILSDIPLSKLVKGKIKSNRRIKGWKIVLLVLGSPIWLSLLIAAFAVVLALYISLWAVIISLWAVFVSLVACSLGGIAGGIILAIFGSSLTGVALIGAGVVCAGLSIFLFFGCKAATKGAALLAKKTVLGIKRCFLKKEDAQ